MKCAASFNLQRTTESVPLQLLTTCHSRATSRHFGVFWARLGLGAPKLLHASVNHHYMLSVGFCYKILLGCLLIEIKHGILRNDLGASNFFVLLMHCWSIGSGLGIGRYSILNYSDRDRVKKNLIGTSLILCASTVRWKTQYTVFFKTQETHWMFSVVLSCTDTKTHH